MSAIDADYVNRQKYTMKVVLLSSNKKLVVGVQEKYIYIDTYIYFFHLFSNNV